MSHSAKFVWVKTSRSIMFEKLNGILERRMEKKPMPFSMYSVVLPSLILIICYSNDVTLKNLSLLAR